MCARSSESSSGFLASRRDGRETSAAFPQASAQAPPGGDGGGRLGAWKRRLCSRGCFRGGIAGICSRVLVVFAVMLCVKRLLSLAAKEFYVQTYCLQVGREGGGRC